MTSKNKTAETAAILETTVANTEALNNRLAVQTEALTSFAASGRLAAEGALSHSAMCFDFQRYCSEGVFSQEDAGKVYASYAAAYNERLALNPRAGIEMITDQKVGRSILATYGHPAVAAQGPELYDRIRVLRNEIKAEERAPGSPTSHFARINRVIAGLAAKVVDAKTVTISDAQIIEALSKEAPKDKGLLEQFKPLADLAMKLAKTNRFDGLSPIAEQLVHMMGEIAAGRGVVNADIAELMKGAPTISQTVQ